jgi:hypothetical protein
LARLIYYGPEKNRLILLNNIDEVRDIAADGPTGIAELDSIKADINAFITYMDAPSPYRGQEHRRLFNPDNDIIDAGIVAIRGLSDNNVPGPVPKGKVAVKQLAQDYNIKGKDPVYQLAKQSLINIDTVLQEVADRSRNTLTQRERELTRNSLAQDRYNTPQYYVSLILNVYKLKGNDQAIDAAIEALKKLSAYPIEEQNRLVSEINSLLAEKGPDGKTRLEAAMET